MEELYYYTYDEESKYISHLKDELRKDGYIRDDKVVKTFALKKDFQDSDFYKYTKIWYNVQKDNPNRRKKNLDDIKKDFFVPYKIKSLEFTEQEINFEKQEDLQRLNLQEKGLQTISIKFKDIEKHIVQKAINIKAKQENSLFQFEKLKEELEIESIEELQTDKLADFDIKVIIQKQRNFESKKDKEIFEEYIENKEKLKIVIKFLDIVFAELKDKIAPKIGSPEFYPANFEKLFGEPKTKTIKQENLDDNIAKNNKRYVLDGFVGTSEEKALIDFIKNSIGNLEQKYSKIYLLRNEEVYKIYDFEKGRGFMPDFILFLKTKDKKETKNGYKSELYYQIFIEPKGTDHLEYDKWKEDFLIQITEKYGFEKVINSENSHYRLIGLPFFNKDIENNFNQFNVLYK